MSTADGLIMRSLMNFPAGLELHIGVCPFPCSARLSSLVQTLGTSAATSYSFASKLLISASLCDPI